MIKHGQVSTRRTVIEDAWLLVKQRVAELERDGKRVGRYRALERELRRTLDFDDGELAA